MSGSSKLTAYLDVLGSRLSEVTEEYIRTLHLRDKDIRDDLINLQLEARSVETAIIQQLLDENEELRKEGP